MMIDIDCFDLKRCSHCLSLIIGRKRTGKTSLMKRIAKELTQDTKYGTIYVASEKEEEWLPLTNEFYKADDLLHRKLINTDAMYCLDYDGAWNEDAKKRNSLELKRMTVLISDVEALEVHANVDYCFLTSMPDKNTWKQLCNYMFPADMKELTNMLRKLCTQFPIVLDLVNKKICFLSK